MGQVFVARTGPIDLLKDRFSAIVGPELVAVLRV